MSGEWKQRRFWAAARAAALSDGPGWRVLLDERPLMTPGKRPLVLPTQSLAEAVAAEWGASPDVIRPELMPLTRAANSAIEKVSPRFEAVAAMLAAYGATDLLCYRATEPEALVRRQAAAWDPLIDWAAVSLRAPLRITHGVIPVDQPPESLAALRGHVDRLDPFGLTALHDLVTLPGSLVLGLAVIGGRLDVADAHALGRLDESYQAEIWGRDDEAEAAAAGRLEAMRTAEQFWRLSRP